MISARELLAAAMFAFVATACSDAPTSPENALAPRSLITISVTPDPTLVSFGLTTCALTNSASGAVSCSWNINNPGLHVLNLWAQAVLTVNYDCVNPKNGRIASSEQRDLETLVQFSGVSDALLVGSNVALPATFLPTDLKGQDHKLNACKGQNVPMSKVYSLTYWDVSVITTSGQQRFSCFGSDNRLGCFT
jgi:hypothetical protein